MLARELSQSEARDPRKRQVVEFWNLVHTLERASNVRLGIWLDRPPTRPLAPVVSSTPLAVFGWQGRSGPAWATLPVNAILRDPAILGTGHADNVVLARRSLPTTVFAALKQRYAYHPDLGNQQEGAWFLEGKTVPKAAPTSLSTLALLPEDDGLGARGIHDGGECLVLVDLYDWWGVLSERALRVYDVGAALDDQRPVQFAQWTKGHRMIWNVELVTSISRSVVQRRFGKEAAGRARPDARSIVVRCARRP
jgi:hypothetical protein